MASPVIKIKRSAVEGNAPTAAQLELGELALNTYDGKLFTEINDGTVSIVEIGGHLNHLAATGISTFGSDKVVVGAAQTQFLVRGNARVVGVLTVGSGSVTLDDDSVNVGAGTTILTTGFQVGGNGVFMHSTGYNVGNTFVHNAGITGSNAVISGVATINQLKMGDNKYLQLGDGPDLQLYHDGSNSYVNDIGTGALFVAGSAVRVQSNDNRLNNSSGTQVIKTDSTTAYLYHSGNERLQTTSDGIELTSTGTDSSAGPVLDFYRNSSSAADADYMGQLKFQGENDADQKIVYAKITGKIQDASDGTEDGLIEFANKKAGSNVITARLRSDSFQLLNSTNFSVAGDSTLTGGLDVDGHVSIAGIVTHSNHIDLPDDALLRLGVKATNPGGELTIEHNSSNVNFIKSPSNRTLQLFGNGGVLIRGSGNENIAYFLQSSVKLYQNQVLKLETTSAGVSIPLDLDVDGHTEVDNLKSVGIATFTNNAIHANIYSTGISTISGFRFPTSDGDEDQALVTDGSGSLSFKTLSGGGGGATGAATTISSGITTATQGQTVFSTPHPHNDGTSTYSTQVFVNGVKQRPQGASSTKDFTTSSNSTITFEEGLSAGAEVVSVVYFGHTIDEEYFTATQGQVLFPLSGSLSAQKNFRVFVNGIKQRVGSDFGVAAPVTLVQPCAEGANVEIVCDNAEDAFVATDQQTNFTPTSTDISEDNMQVYVNGVQLFSGIDYSIGSPSVTFTDATGLTVGDEVDVCIRRTA